MAKDKYPTIDISKLGKKSPGAIFEEAFSESISEAGSDIAKLFGLDKVEEKKKAEWPSFKF